MPVPAGAAQRKALETSIERAELDLEKRKKALAAMRRRLPALRVQDYEFGLPEGRRLLLSAAFGRREDLLVIHNMGTRCRYCTLWADELNGVLPHLRSRAAVLVVSPDEPRVQAAFAKRRGWEFPMASAKGTTFFADMGFEPEPGRYWPGVSSFGRDGRGRLVRVAKRFFGPGDDFCGVWHYFDLLAGGIADWEPQLSYPR